MWAKAAGSGRLRECRHSRLRICFRSLAKAACGSWRKDQKEAVKQKTVREKESKVRRQSVPTRGGGFGPAAGFFHFRTSQPDCWADPSPNKKESPPTDGRGLSVSCSPLQSEEQAHQWIHRGKGAAESWWKKYPGLWRRSTQGG